MYLYIYIAVYMFIYVCILLMTGENIFMMILLYVCLTASFLGIMGIVGLAFSRLLAPYCLEP